MNPHKETVRKLAQQLDTLDSLLDNESDVIRQDAILSVREAIATLWVEAEEKTVAWESERPRREAEARLAYHIENDTLDLY